MKVEEAIPAKGRVDVWLFAASISFAAWLMHSFAVQYFLASFKQLVTKFLTKA